MLNQYKMANKALVFAIVVAIALMCASVSVMFKSEVAQAKHYVAYVANGTVVGNTGVSTGLVKKASLGKRYLIVKNGSLGPDYALYGPFTRCSKTGKYFKLSKKCKYYRVNSNNNRVRTTKAKVKKLLKKASVSFPYNSPKYRSLLWIDTTSGKASKIVVSVKPW